MQLRAALLGALLAVATPARAAEDHLKDGTYHIHHRGDLFYSGDFELERVYNSQSGFQGIFGHGWSNEWEVHLVPLPDRSLFSKESGEGSSNRFYPVDHGPADVSAGVDALVAAVRAGRKLTAQQATDFRATVIDDAGKLAAEWERCLRNGWAAPPVLAEGLELVSRSRRSGYQVIRATATGYQRTLSDGKIQSFDRAGRLVRVDDRNGNWVRLAHDAAARITSITDNVGRRIVLHYDRAGLVAEARGHDGRRARYRYDRQQRLVDTTTADGDRLRYRYDGNHNLTRIDYDDGTWRTVRYYTGRMAHVRWVTDADGTHRLYSYGSSADGRHLVTGVESFDDDGRRVSRGRHEWRLGRTDAGAEYTAWTLTDVDGERTESRYDVNSRPLRIERAGEVTGFEYDGRGNVIVKDTSTELIRVRWHPTMDKVIRVDRQGKQAGAGATWTTFRYDDRGNLVEAADHQGRRAVLTLDGMGRYQTITDEHGAALHFTYNRDKRPVEIRKDGVGTVTVEYEPNGEIKKVTSTGGHKVSLAVTSAFQNLLELIQQADIALTF